MLVSFFISKIYSIDDHDIITVYILNDVHIPFHMPSCPTDFYTYSIIPAEMFPQQIKNGGEVELTPLQKGSKMALKGENMCNISMAAVPHFNSINEALVSLFGSGVKLVQTRRISGGDINEAYGLTLADGKQIFMKTNRKENLPFFRTEVSGLAAIARTGAIGTPQVLCTGTEEDGAGKAFLMLEFITAGRRIPDYWRVFADELAAMHQASVAGFVAEGQYGFTSDNYIGAGGQVNTSCGSWIDFFREYRLVPQFRKASRYFGASESRKIARLLDRMGDVLVEPEHPSLLHGDLWSGNVMTGTDGRAWLIDPAVYVGHAEADLAMTELFGGFPEAFYAAYTEAFPLQPGYEERRDLYNLYHLLNHLNLFGRGYLSPVKNVIDRYQ